MVHNARNEVRNERAAVPSILVVVVLLAVAVIAEAQQAKKFPRIGYLSSPDAASQSTRAEAIRLALREQVTLRDRLSSSSTDMGRGRLIGTLSLPPSWCVSRSILLWQQARTICPCGQKRDQDDSHRYGRRWGDPVETGLIESLARPGGNVTGITNLNRELGGKRLELLKEAVPKIVRVAVLYNPAQPSNVRELKEVLPAAARALGLTLQPWEVRTADDFEKVFAALDKQRPDGLYLLGGGPLMIVNQKRIVGFTLKSRLPSVWGSRRDVDAGGLMYYGADLVDSYRRVAYYVDRILKGAKPADLPVEQPTKFEFVINLKTAKHIGLTIAPEVLARTSKLIK